MSKAQMQTVEAPTLFIEQVKTAKPQEFITALADYRRTTRNASRKEAPLSYLVQQASYAWSVYSALNEEGSTAVFVRADNNGSFQKLNASRATFRTDYPQIVAALNTAQSNGVEVAHAEMKTGAKGNDYVRVSAVGGVIGVA